MFSFKRSKTQKRLKICIGGDGGVGKTSYFKALMGLNDTKYKHERSYNATPLNQYNLMLNSVLHKHEALLIFLQDFFLIFQFQLRNPQLKRHQYLGNH